ncbi:hypothetical protein BN961_03197 [Afipia felis]|uniref:Uncharacterized protein n=1 Tax=Afipia felis TaxID=1035 RepID=A0A090MQY0_AFIFE|nr:hypothetical protein BN961_03197 [Afipia felis]
MLMRTRGPIVMPPSSLSGSVVRLLRIWNVVWPTLTVSPTLRFNRASNTGSTAAP